jgi:hypothetical protein
MAYLLQVAIGQITGGGWKRSKTGVRQCSRILTNRSAPLERANSAEAAASEPDERIRQQLLYLEQEWQQVLESYQFIESLERLLLDRALPPEVDKLPKDFPPEWERAQREGPFPLPKMIEKEWDETANHPTANACPQPLAPELPV